MPEYKMTTKKNWFEVKKDILIEFERWGVTDYMFTAPNQTQVTVQYILRGREVSMTMGKQERPVDNLRVIFYAISSIRLNEVRGMAEIFESAYLAIAAPVLDKDPYDVLGLPRGIPLAVCEAQYKILAKQYHPDNGGDPQKFKEINTAIEKVREGKK